MKAGIVAIVIQIGTLLNYISHISLFISPHIVAYEIVYSRPDMKFLLLFYVVLIECIYAGVWMVFGTEYFSGGRTARV